MPSFNCKQCKKIFTDKPSRRRLFCSRPCYWLNRKGWSAVPANKINCKNCGVLFKARYWAIHNRGKKYCSINCYSKHPTGGMKGKKHSPETRKKLSLSRVEKIGSSAPNWKGGIYRETKKRTNDKLERMRFRETIQKQVFERDNYTCQSCLVRGGSLQVDHIQSWADYAELRFDINNCRTLCMGCHYRITVGRPMPKNIRSWGHNLKHIKERLVN